MNFKVYRSNCNPVKQRFIAVQEGSFSERDIIEVAIMLIAHSNYGIIVTEDLEYTMRYSVGDIISYQDKSFLDACKTHIIKRMYYRDDLDVMLPKPFIAEDEFPKIVNEVYTGIEANSVFDYLRLFNGHGAKYLYDKKTSYDEFTKAIKATVPIMYNLIYEILDGVLERLDK